MDADTTARHRIRDFLLGSGYHVMEAGSADEAFLLLAGDHIKMVISDMELPELDSLTFLWRVRRGWPDIGLVALSTGNAPTDRLPANAQVLRKPFSEDGLRIVVGAT